MKLTYEWSPSELNTDGTPVETLAATRVVFGIVKSAELGEVLEHRWVSPTDRQADFEVPGPGTYFAAAYPINSHGREAVDTTFALREVL